MSLRQSKIQIWGIPIILGALSVIGLLSALLADGLGDVVSWLTLGATVMVATRFVWRRHS
jgi:hypothetical protein